MPRQDHDGHHPARCCCDDCNRRYAEYFARCRELDALAALDPEPLERRRAELDAWLAQDPPAVVPEVCP